MAKQHLVKDLDKFIVRLPEGMRERIKAKADRAGMSMNDAIVWCLEQHFPAPTTVEQKIDELVEMVAILKGDDTYKGVDRLVAEVHDTIIDVLKESVKGSPDFKSAVSERFDRWNEEQAERHRDDHEDPFDDQYYHPNFENIDWDAPRDQNDPMAPHPLKKDK